MLLGGSYNHLGENENSIYSTVLTSTHTDTESWRTENHTRLCQF